jgi:peroxiredoxin
VRRLFFAAMALALLGLACQESTEAPTADASVLKEGDRAPDFTLTSPSAKISLADYRGKKPVLLYFSMGPG